MSTKKHIEKAEWINNMTREQEGLAEGPKNEIHTDKLKKTLKEYQTGKRQEMMEYMILVQEIHLHSRQTSARNGKMLTGSTTTRLDDQRK